MANADRNPFADRTPVGAENICKDLCGDCGQCQRGIGFSRAFDERLVKSIQRSKMEAVAMDSSTTMERELRPTRQNSGEADDKQCDYTVLTQIVETRTHPAAPQTIPRPGAEVPSIDASDPLGGQLGPVYREETQVAFALFRSSHYEPIVDDYILERASATVSDSFLAAMDRIANRVSHELKKKKK